MLSELVPSLEEIRNKVSFASEEEADEAFEQNSFYTIQSLKKIVRGDEIPGLAIDKFDDYLKREPKRIEAILEMVNNKTTAKKQKDEAYRLLNQMVRWL